MARVADRAICLRERDWSETSQTVVLLSEQHGLIRGLAKGSRRDRGPFGGGFELLTSGVFEGSLRDDGRMSAVYAWDLEQMFPGVRSGFLAFACSMHAADVVSRLLGEGERHPGCFHAVIRMLSALDSGADPVSAHAVCIARVLADTGHALELEADVMTGETLPREAEKVAFSPALGGFVASEHAGTFGARVSTLDALRAIAADGESGIKRFGEEVRLRCLRLLVLFTRSVIGHEAPSERVLEIALPSRNPRTDLMQPV